MGNQNTSGIVEEDKAIDNGQGAEEEKAVDNAQGVSPPEHAVEEDSNDKSPPSEGLVCEDKVIEDQMEGSDAVMDMSTNGLDSMLSHEEQEQPYTLKGQLPSCQTWLNNLDSKCASHEAADATLEEKEDMPSLLGEQSKSSNTNNDAPRIGLLHSPTPQNDHEDKPMLHESGLADANHTNSVDHEEKTKLHELGHADTNHTSYVDQEITINPTDKIETDFKAKGDNLLDDAEELNQGILEKVIHWESEENGHETTEKCEVEMQSAQEIDTQTPPGVKNSGEIESKARALHSNPSHVGVAKNELRKSPSFDFGISLDTRSKDSDQTPLLYLDKSPRRSLSSCSTLKFQHKTIRAEYVKKPLHLEDEGITPQVEEKTIQMEINNSQAINTIQENPIKASPSREDEAEKSPKGRPKPRSPLFTTCLSCTAAIS